MLVVEVLEASASWASSAASVTAAIEPKLEAEHDEWVSKPRGSLSLLFEAVVVLGTVVEVYVPKGLATILRAADVVAGPIIGFSKREYVHGQSIDY